MSDVLFTGGTGPDSTITGAGNDTLIGNGGADTLDGAGGDDLIYGAAPSGAGASDPSGDRLIGNAGNDTILGGAGDDTIDGGADDDSIVGEAGSDSINGGAGDDIIFGAAPAGGDTLSSDTLIGGDGFDYLYGSQGGDVIYTDGVGGVGTGGGDVSGDEGNDTIYGSDDTASIDIIRGEGGSDLISGGAGDDDIQGDGGVGDPGNDTILGGAGNDNLGGGAGDDIIDGGADSDTIEGGGGADSLVGGGGNDWLSYRSDGTGVSVDLATGAATGGDADGDTFSGFANLSGGDAGDSLVGDGSDNVLTGNDGNDTIVGGDGDDTIIGDDVFNNYVGSNLLDGGAGNDSILGGGGNDTVDAGEGADTVRGGLGDDSLNGGNGTDWISFADATGAVTVTLNDAGNGTAQGALGNDTLISFQDVEGGSGNDVITTGNGPSTILGGGGNDLIDPGDGSDSVDAGSGDDTVRGSLGSDTLIGGIGQDWVDYSDLAGPVTISLDDSGNGGATLDGGGTDILTSFEAVIGTANRDSIVTGAGNDTIMAGGGNDTIQGGAGADSVDAGDDNDKYFWSTGGGSDTLAGGTGTDTLDLQGWTGPNISTDSIANSIYGAWTVSGSATDRLFTNAAGTTIHASSWEAIVCFAGGTRIATARGEVAVEDLRIGDLIVTLGARGALQPVQWIGRTRVNLARHPEPELAQPILIRAGALAEGIPFRDLRVSPEHALFLDGCLVPAGLLVNGRTIIREAWCPAVTYWHVELPAHAVLLAEGAAAESYLDDGNRKHFDNGPIATLFKDFASERANGTYDRDACHPVLRHGAALEAIRARLAERVEVPAGATRRANSRG